ncbi:TFIIH complex subunit tfb5 [Xylographa opegraphella]|nr:TFIIH complex subunit tfb5 [Xylographa opegraphella]
MPKAIKGVLVECDPSIKAIILKIDQDKHDYIIEDLDDQTLVVKENQLSSLKARLEEELANTQTMPEFSGSD